MVMTRFIGCPLLLLGAHLPGTAGLVSYGASAALTLNGDAEGADSGINPIRRVVKMLQNMVEKVEAEAKKEEDMYDKYMCYCKTTGSQLSLSIASSTAKVPEVQHDIEEAEASLTQLSSDLKAAQDDRAAAQSAIEAATAQREKEHKAFVDVEKEHSQYLSALGKAIPAIQKGMSGGALLQQQSHMATAALRQAVGSAAGVTEFDRQLVISFLGGSATDSNGYVPKSAEIVGILKTIQEDFQKNLDEATAEEQESVKLFDELLAAKRKQVSTLGQSIEKKIQRIGETKVEVADMKSEMTESEAALVADQKLSNELEQTCNTKDGEWAERQKTRSHELVALHDTIKVLNDDDALDLFKKTLASPSLLQVHRNVKQLRQKVVDLLKQKKGARPAMDFLMLALSGKKVDFSKVIKMVEDMVSLLKEEQVNDDSKKEYCEKQTDLAEDKVKDLSKIVADLELSIEEKGDAMKELDEELKELAKGISELDRNVAQESAMRKEQHEEYVVTTKENREAKQLLAFAKNRLNKFYNPALWNAPAKRQLSAEEKIVKNLGGEVNETAAMFVQISAHDDGDSAAPAPAPAAAGQSAPAMWGEYRSKGQETNGVIAMIDLLIKDLDTEITEAEVEEKNSQKAYEELTNDAAAKRAADVKNIGAKQMARADFEEAKVAATTEKQTTSKELQATKMYAMQIHQECDWLVQNYDLRKDARSDEMETLHQAKAILSGADFAFVQSQPAVSAAPRRLRGA